MCDPRGPIQNVSYYSSLKPLRVTADGAMNAVVPICCGAGQRGLGECIEASVMF
jgi:hypothetical protein